MYLWLCLVYFCASIFIHIPSMEWSTNSDDNLVGIQHLWQTCRFILMNGRMLHMNEVKRSAWAALYVMQTRWQGGRTVLCPMQLLFLQLFIFLHRALLLSIDSLSNIFLSIKKLSSTVTAILYNCFERCAQDYFIGIELRNIDCEIHSRICT